METNMLEKVQRIEKTTENLLEEIRLKKPLQYGIYKGVEGKHGALRFSLLPAYYPGLKGKGEGVIFLDMAPTIGPNSYDWEKQKITIALGYPDISKILLFLKMYATKVDENGNSIPMNIYHDSSMTKNLSPKTLVSTLQITKSKAYDSFFWRATKKDQKEQLEAKVPVSPEEMIIISNLLNAAIPRILGW